MIICTYFVTTHTCIYYVKDVHIHVYVCMYILVSINGFVIISVYLSITSCKYPMSHTIRSGLSCIRYWSENGSPDNRRNSLVIYLLLVLANSLTLPKFSFLFCEGCARKYQNQSIVLSACSTLVMRNKGVDKWINVVLDSVLPEKSRSMI